MMKAKEFVARSQSVDEFYQANRKDLQRMAAYILRRWPAPNDVGVEDVVQELLLACWRKRLKFDPSRGPTPEQFLSFNAISAAKRYVHRQRRARGDRAIGTFDLLTSTGNIDEQDVRVIEPEVERRENLQELLAECATTREAIYLLVYEEESARSAGEQVYKDGRLREQHRRKHAAESRAAVKQSIKEQRAWPE